MENTALHFNTIARELRALGVSLTWRHKNQVYCVRLAGQKNGFETASLAEAREKGLQLVAVQR
jgi:hypothetical protein